jgi:ABC-type dipeptide/oligopeptide/nickel transport system ATPase subunit
MLGREQIVSAIIEQVETDRFVSIIGPSGIGKITVAIAAAGPLSNKCAQAAIKAALAGNANATVCSYDFVSKSLPGDQHETLLIRRSSIAARNVICLST